MLGLATFASLLLSVSCQVTGNYAIQISAPTPVGTAGRDLANYPQCAVSNVLGPSKAQRG